MIALVGPSGSGKDTAAKILEQSHGFDILVSYTTRPPRHYERDGEHYHFISEDDFQRKLKAGFFAENTEYRDWHYGAAKEDCTHETVIVIEPKGLAQLAQWLWPTPIFVVYVAVSEETRRHRLEMRGDDPAEIERRIITDRELFAGMDEKADYVLVNEINSSYSLVWEVDVMLHSAEFNNYMMRVYP